MQLLQVVKRRILYLDGKRRWTTVKVYPPVWELEGVMPYMARGRKKTPRRRASSSMRP